MGFHYLNALAERYHSMPSLGGLSPEIISKGFGDFFITLKPSHTQLYTVCLLSE